MALETKEFTLTGLPEDGGLALSFIRVTPKLPDSEDDATTPPSGPGIRRLSLILLHCVNSHKETWLPTLEHLFEIQHKVPNNRFTVVEAWCMDAPSHGRAGVLNEAKLRNYPNGITGSQWARGIPVLLNSGLIGGNSVVGIGHSAGACILIQSTSGYALNRLPYSSIILMEPPMMTREIYAKAVNEGTALLRAIELARTRKDVWATREEARAWHAKRHPWRRWDPRAFDLHIKHTLCDLPTVTYPDKKGVTLCVTRASEVGGYSHFEDAFEALELLKGLCRSLPVHAVFGEFLDTIAAETQEANVSESEGRPMKSIVKVAKAGHLLVQENPSAAALALWGLLHEDYGGSAQLPARL